MSKSRKMAHFIQYPLFPPKYKTLDESMRMTKTQLRNYIQSSELTYGYTWIHEYLTRLESEGQTLLKLHASPNKPTAAYLVMIMSAYFRHASELDPTLQGYQQLEALHITRQTQQIRFAYTVQAFIEFNL